MEWTKIVASKSNIRDHALIHHAVPARRLRRILPKDLVLETFEDPETGEELGFIGVGVAMHRKFRSVVLGVPQIDFWQVGYRTYGLYKGLACVYYFGADLDTWSSFVYQRLGAWEVSKGSIDVAINRDQSGGYDIYECKADSEHGMLDFYISAKNRPGAQSPFANGADKEKFFHQRYHQLWRSSTGVMGDQVIEQRMKRNVGVAKEGELKSFKCDYWVRLGLLKEEEVLSRFHSALVTPSLDVVFYPMLPSLLMPRAA